MRRALVLGCSNSTVSELRQYLSKDYSVIVQREFTDSLEEGEVRLYEYIFVGVHFLESEKSDPNGKSCRASLQVLWKCYPEAKIIALAPKDEVRSAVRAVRAGADDYLTLPLSLSELDLVLERAEELEIQAAQMKHLETQLLEKSSLKIAKTSSAAMMEVYNKVISVADKTANVLLTGETGVGKGVVAKLIHESSNRKQGPFITVHCGAIPDDLIESELFGHEKGSFTGAIKRKLGRFELASGGTIFLDEIGTITPSAQIKLLQVLQESQFQRVGGEEEIKVDIRIIAATNENLKDLADKNLFRKDLFYRLNVFPIHIPPLRERIEDLPELLTSFVKHFGKMHQKEIFGLGTDVIEALSHYKWPGNIRELENLVERACILESSHKLQLSSFPIEVTGQRAMDSVVEVETNLTLAEARNRILENFEKKYVTELMTNCGGKIKEVAKAAGIGVRQVHKLLTKYGLSGREFRQHKHQHESGVNSKVIH